MRLIAPLLLSARRHMPFSADAAASLGPPFALCAYLGFTCWVGGLVVSILSYMRHLTLLQTDDQYRQAVFLDAMRVRHARDASTPACLHALEAGTRGRHSRQACRTRGSPLPSAGFVNSGCPQIATDCD